MWQEKFIQVAISKLADLVFLPGMIRGNKLSDQNAERIRLEIVDHKKVLCANQVV